MARIYPMFLIIASLVLLVLPGVLFNTYGSVGFKTTDPGLTCGGPYAPGQLIDVTCQGSVTEGCQAVANDCTLTTSPTLSFLNQNSPFTQLLGGNIFGVWNALTSNGNINRGPFDPNGGGAFYHADCFLNQVTGSGGDNNITLNAFAFVIKQCTQTDSSNFNASKASSTFSMTAWNTNATTFSTVMPPTVNFFQLINNATSSINCANQGFWYQTTQPTIGYSTIGCDYIKTLKASNTPQTVAIYSFLIAVPCNLPGTSGCKALMPSGVPYHIQVLVQPEGWDTRYCTDAFKQTSIQIVNWYISQQCINMETWFTTPHSSGGFGSSGAANFGFLTPFLTILLGLVLFLIGTGINISGGGSIFGSGTSFGVGTNDQGSRMAQILGLSLIIWAPMYSEFSTWFTSGLLPFGLDGTVTAIATGSGIIAFAITGMFFAGVLWQLMSIE